MADITTTPGTAESLSLLEAPLSTPLMVKRISGGSRILARLSSMGILPGETVTVIQRCNGGPLILEVKGARVALGKGIALTVIVGR